METAWVRMDMRTPRWLVAVMVTVAAFAMTTWICGALILPVVMRDPGVRWGVAGACGVAVAALAALWGHSFASAGRSEDPVPANVQRATSAATTTGLGNTRNRISGGTFHGSVVQGRDVSVISPDVTNQQLPDPES